MELRSEETQVSGSHFVRGADRDEDGWRPSNLSKFHASLLFGIDTAAVILDRQLRILGYNRPFLRATGLRSAELRARLQRGVSSFDLVYSEERTDVRAAEECLERDEVVRVPEATLQSVSGERFVSRLSCVPLEGPEDDPAKLLVVFPDVSAEARMEGRLHEQLSVARAHADELERRLDDRTVELTVALDELMRMSSTDAFTGLLTRRAFGEYAEKAVEHARRHSRHVGILLCDLDRFKKLNDTRGHRVGDEVLAECADELRSIVRNSDHVARFGGEEFSILLTETDPETVYRTARRCKEAIAAMSLEAITGEADLQQTASFGVAVFPIHGDSLDELIDHADRALWEAKQQGRNQVVVYDPSIETPTPHESGDKGVRLLVVDPDSERREQIVKNLPSSYTTSAAANPSEALANFNRADFDVVIASQGIDAAGGIDFLGRAFEAWPDSLRILCADDHDCFESLRGPQLARVDFVLLPKDRDTQLVSAIDDGLARREVLRERLLYGRRQGGLRPHFWQADELNRVLEEGSVYMATQPIIRSSDMTHFGHEALCRTANDIGLTTPNLFDVALREGKLWELGRLTRKLAVERHINEKREGQLFINLHPAELSDARLLLSELQLESISKDVVLEITERASIRNVKRVGELIKDLRERGYRLAVDDLGAGYASLNSVAMLSPDFIKVDMTIIRNIHRSSTKQRLVKRITDFANDEGIHVVAEGVETQAESDMSKSLGCHLLQGFYLGRPT